MVMMVVMQARYVHFATSKALSLCQAQRTLPSTLCFSHTMASSGATPRQQQQEEAAVEEAGVQAIASKSHGSDDNNDDDDVVVTVDMNQWPKPLSPLSGDIGKGIELQRALKAEASMASQPAFSPSDIIYQDEWLFVINKPSGIYAGHVLETVTSMLSPKKQCEEVSEVVEEDSIG